MEKIELKGSWDQAFAVLLPTTVRSKSNFRRGKDWSKYAKYEKDLAITFKEILPQTWELGSAAEKVSERPKVIIQIIAESVIDAGNLSKSILDALEGVLYHNDSSVVAVSSASIRKRAGATYIAAARLDKKATFRDVQKAVGELNILSTELYSKSKLAK